MKAKKIYWAVLGIFIAAMIVIESMGILGEDFWMLYGVIIAVFFVISIVISRKYLDELTQKLEKLEPLRLENPDAYIAEMEQLLKRERGKGIVALLLTNIGGGYMVKGDYETALEKLLTVPEKGLTQEMAQIYYVRLALTLFHLDKDEAARRLLSLKESTFTLARQNPKVSVEYHILQVLRYVSEVKRKEARDYLAAHPEILEKAECAADVKLIRQKL